MSTIEKSTGHGKAPTMPPAPNRFKDVVRQLMGTRRVIVGFVMLVLLAVFAFVGPHISGWEVGQRDFGATLEAPSAEHWMGTNRTGQDIFTQATAGLQKSLLIGLLVAVASTCMAALVGAFAGYFGGVTDRALMWVADLALVLPNFVILAILSRHFVGQGGWFVLVILLAAFSWMVTSKMVRGLSISLREREYIHAARFMGVPPYKIILRHILPNMSSLLIADATITVSTAIIGETALSYFGLGVQSPDISLGMVIAEGSSFSTTAPWMFAFPTVLLVLMVLAVNMIGDGLRDALDPQSKSRRS
ncbi:MULTISPECIES: ABC transporter permease [Nocardiopsis]|uniref:Oligopeptide transport system permease protein OppC n=1 Tax=Nocardiopsis dassonvillei (strain ATCC 23218 / DSM 43111 / CIP 107115 / JCM 7437 / KCTC 9190 / NBRC 14626 / NCTC 10488 / NRRL B-5397 / IMRU 509) TaxID=446468 RepID=D7AXA7_NOCDD|nr:MULTISPECIES: ABC transporter permease [Nocardiopsis]ADH65981.1 binding-protein-dependent transport systems inner membrane component [Nocardiopsis dassonvillei subsp. dassonvillei DSM 43111]APC34301.1 peptide ABC transporter permease [Nocardiopsis dassonvillei]MCP3016414.1 ABC transporter permease [Nocardiopsis dassonvillei]NKY79001.1 ABC transporter permease [Nocardiopsis dassonvillei]VEI92002.1 Oligopeptide transport system permease protein oppC [Nocardiopsis dassonvillei]